MGNMEILETLQNWYKEQCNGDWEHQSGITIGTLDNPGWEIKIDLIGTKLETKSFKTISYAIGVDLHPKSNEWMLCEIKDKQFFGFGDPQKLEEILIIFLKWAGYVDEKK